MSTFFRRSKFARWPAPGPTRSFATLAGVLAWAALQSLSLGCTPKPSTVTALTPPGIVAREAFAGAILCDPENHDVLLSWIAGDSTRMRVWFSRSADKGTTWSVPAVVSPAGERLRLEPESSPQMVCDNEHRVGIAWSTWTPATMRNPGLSELRFAYSYDFGRSWSAPVTVNKDNAGNHGSGSLHDIALHPKGKLFASWLGRRPDADDAESSPVDSAGASVWFARSDDFGAHWGPNVVEWTRACPNSRVCLLGDPAGSLFAAFRKDYPGQIHDAVLARIGGPPVRVHEDGWRVARCPPASPAMRLSRDGTLRLAWYTGAVGLAGVWFRQSVPELMDSASAPIPVLVGQQLPIVHVGVGEAGMSGTLIACDADSTGANQLTLVRVESSGQRVIERFVMPGTQGASYPSVATERASSVAYLAWTSRSGGHSALRLARWNAGR